MRIYLRQHGSPLGFPFDAFPSTAPTNWHEPPPRPRRTPRAVTLGMPSPDHPFDGRYFTLTGTLDSLVREDASARIEALGGAVRTSVNGRTDYLVAGADPGPLKIATAQRLISEGGKIQVSAEAEFLAMLVEAETAASQAG